MTPLDALREALPESARDLKANLQLVLGDGSLTPSQRAGIAITSALAAKDPVLAEALRSSLDGVSPPVEEDARAAAALMGMNNVFYRFKHFVRASGTYEKKPARLRMMRLAKPATTKLDLELMCLAVSAINGCDDCVVSHERTAREAGATVDQIFDAARIAAVIAGVAAARVG